MSLFITSANDVLYDIYDIINSFDDRIEFYHREYAKLVRAYCTCKTNESVYLLKLSHLNNEKMKINSSYRAMIKEYIQNIPEQFRTQDIIEYLTTYLIE